MLATLCKGTQVLKDTHEIQFVTAESFLKRRGSSSKHSLPTAFPRNVNSQVSQDLAKMVDTKEAFFNALRVCC